MKKYFEKFPEVQAAISEKKDGSMKILPGGPNEKSRNNIFLALGIEAGDVYSAEQTHGPEVKIVDDKSPNIISGADALVSKKKGVFLSVTVADCFPVYFYDPSSGIVGIAHAGWRGMLGGIISNTVSKIEETGGGSRTLHVAIGPGIGVCHFEIGEDIVDKFEKFKDQISKRDGKIFVDLKKIIKEQLIEAGVDIKNIEDSGDCTYCDQNYFSYRRDKPAQVEAMLSVIGLK